MAANTQLTHLPLQAIRPNLISIATALRVGIGNHGDDIVDLGPAATCRNAVALVRYASPFLEQSILIWAPFAVLGYGIYHYVWRGLNLPQIIDLIRSRFVGRVTVPSKMVLHGQVMLWMSENNVGVDTRSVTVHSTVYSTTVPASLEAPMFHFDTGNPYGRSRRNKYNPSGIDWSSYGVTSGQDGSLQRQHPSLSYVPAIGSTSFNFQGHSLWIHRENPTEHEIVDSTGRPVKGKTQPREADITIFCYSLFGGLKPVQDFLEHVRAINDVKIESQVRIFRLSKYVNEGDTWDTKVITRPIRNLDSVSMEAHKKQELIEDIKIYLSSESKSWYANRGIPWRRGYLFYGPPGTGKTSFCTALAGYFDMPLYILSLSNPHLNDDILEMCFDSLPPRCLVLIEDVDSAGVGREPPKKEKKKKSKRATVVGGIMSSSSPRGVTLAGLLNTIDGPVSHEGHVLVMTSNSPDNLDAAMLRPGRIDKKVLFGNASPEVVEQLFLHIFVEAPHEKTDAEDAQEYDLPTLAKQFACSIPEDKLSPAEIQNYLLETREDPVGAVAGAQDWAASVLQTKGQGRNVEKFAGQVGVEADMSDKVEVNPQVNGMPDPIKALNAMFAANGYSAYPGIKPAPSDHNPLRQDSVTTSWTDLATSNGSEREGSDGAANEKGGDEGEKKDNDEEKNRGENGTGSSSSSEEDEPNQHAQVSRRQIRSNARIANRELARMRMEVGGRFPYPMP